MKCKECAYYWKDRDDDVPYCHYPVEDCCVDDIDDEDNYMEEDNDGIECQWCGELFTESEGAYEKDMGFLCDRCIEAIKSRGEELWLKN